MDQIQVRYDLSKDRILELLDTDEGFYRDYIVDISDFFRTIFCVLEHTSSDLVCYKRWNDDLYRDIIAVNYDVSYANPTYATEQYGEEIGQYLSWVAVRTRDSIVSAYEHDLYQVVLRMELFLQTVRILTEEDHKEHSLKELIYYYIHDYDYERQKSQISDMLCFHKDGIYDIVMNSDFSDLSYLYRYGEYITDNEEKMSLFLQGLPVETLDAIAHTYTEGYRKGFEIAGIDLSKKKTVQIRYSIGYEPVVRQAVIQFEKMGLEPVFTRRTNPQAFGIISTSPNPQYGYDHRFDDALYLNKALVSERLKLVEHIYEEYKDEAAVYAGPAVIEVFGEKLFTPVPKEANPAYTAEQEKMIRDYTMEYSLIQNKYIPEETRSFTIIAYPIPEIGDDFEDIFYETMKVNTLDEDRYRQIQQTLIDALDQGTYVHVTGRGTNHTDLIISLHKLSDPSTMTNFENCLADVNIPLGEVFTSPLLKGTNGVLHVRGVYLEGLYYKDLNIVLKDGMVEDYTCANYDTDTENKRYIKENILHNKDTLPVGEFAIGTNTTAYAMGRRYGIEAKLPILIAEKTGPHFALGDTCYSMSEDVSLYNPDGKEIIAKENECSALRHTDINKAYFNCHTDITIPYDELDKIIVHTQDGGKIAIIEDGLFVLPGTDYLNKELQDLS